ncbi:MAG: hypothetical protein M1825_005939 [Sarcosagium campestre]|nr:MAG: hypothetical protein M1825_005939 [Sarcosagium campestre]
MIRDKIRFSFVLSILVLLSKTTAAEARNYTTLSEVFPQLQGLSPVSKHAGELGGQSYTKCCLLAVNASFDIVNGSIESNGRFISDSYSHLLAQQWPCGAAYNGSRAGAPVVKAPYSWVNSNCPGWEKNRGSNVDDWALLFVGFLLPAVAFCLIIPRSQELNISRRLFDVELGRVSGLLSSPLLALAAGLLVGIDTILWLVFVFTAPGPIIFSGLYEAYLDKKLLGFVRTKIENGRLSRTDRARILFAILVGNLDLHWGDTGDGKGKAWRDTQSLVSNLDIAERRALRSQDDTDLKALDVAVRGVKVRLRSMLACQYPYGSTVGAPVVFYMGSFVYALKEISNKLGANSSSHTLAFGCLWIIMPLEAIISGCLLAGNNPNTLEGIVGTQELTGSYPTLPGFVPVYETGYKPAWMWNRGRSKQHWADAIAQHYDMDNLADVAMTKIQDWFKIALVSLSLILVPCVLAFILAYFTPTVGISCRSMTFMFYFISEFFLTMLWIWKYLENGFTRGTSLTQRRRELVWYVLVTFCAACAMFMGIGGTVMQIMGVYRNPLCNLPVGQWISKEGLIVLSSNTPLAIQLAHDTWLPIGVSGASFLGFICYMGWWYNTYLRMHFGDLVASFDAEEVGPSTFLHLKGNLSRSDVTGREGSSNVQELHLKGDNHDEKGQV